MEAVVFNVVAVIHSAFANENFEIKIYPNPAHDWLEIISEKELKSVEVFNVLGELVMGPEFVLSSRYLHS